MKLLDAIALGGLLLIAVGAGLIALPAGLVVGGVEAVAVGVGGRLADGNRR